MILPLPFHRLILPAFSGGVAAALTVALGAPPLAALPALLLGAVAAWLLDGEPAPAPVTTARDASVDRFVTARPLIAALMETITDPLMLVEGQKVMMANAAALELLGRHIPGQDARLAIRHPEATQRMTGPIRADAPPVRLTDLGGRDRHWDLVVSAFGSDRRLVRLIDRSDTHAAERMRVDFVANASHELRTPLATLIGFIETLEDPKVSDAARTRFLRVMDGEARRMQQLIDDLISLSRIEAEKHSLPDSRIALAPLAAEVAAVAEAASDSRRVQLEILNPEAQIRGERSQLSQLLHNLVGNALKYGRPDTPVTVRIDMPDEATVRLSVADEGEGIAPEHLPRLTERFYRIDSGRSRVLGGTGLGLAIVKHIVERHGGKLDIRSQQGVGTTVSVSFPSPRAPLS